MGSGWGSLERRIFSIRSDSFQAVLMRLALSDRRSISCWRRVEAEGSFIVVLCPTPEVAFGVLFLKKATSKVVALSVVAQRLPSKQLRARWMHALDADKGELVVRVVVRVLDDKFARPPNFIVKINGLVASEPAFQVLDQRGRRFFCVFIVGGDQKLDARLPGHRDLENEADQGPLGFPVGDVLNVAEPAGEGSFRAMPADFGRQVEGTQASDLLFCHLDICHKLILLLNFIIPVASLRLGGRFFLLHSFIIVPRQAAPCTGLFHVRRRFLEKNFVVSESLEEAFIFGKGILGETWEFASGQGKSEAEPQGLSGGAVEAPWICRPGPAGDCFEHANELEELRIFSFASAFPEGVGSFFEVTTMRRLSAIITAWVLGWIIYLMAMVLTVYDGILSLIFHPFLAALVTTLTVALGLTAGLLLRIPLLERFWRSSWLWACSLAVGAVLLMCFGRQWGVTETFTDPETGRQWVGLHSGVAVGSYLALLFAVVNWPSKKSE